MNALEFIGARKVYRSRRKSTIALSELSFVVPRGGIFGFLGPNGAGKTTAIRCLLGLVSLDCGEARMLGRRVPDELPEVIGAVGSMAETPSALIPSCSTAENLHILARLGGIAKPDVDGALESMGLGAYAAVRAGKLSLGLKQRLGLAAALLKDPELLILDEPATGLDPAGARDVRTLLKKWATEKHKTIFLSSHRLDEIQQICDRVAIIANGTLRFSGELESLMSSSRTKRWLVQVQEAETREAANILRAAGLKPVRMPGQSALLLRSIGVSPCDVTRVLAEAGIYLTGLRPEGPDLESLFLRLTAEAGSSHD